MLCCEIGKTGTRTFLQLQSIIWQLIVKFCMHLPLDPAVTLLESHPQRTGKYIT